MLVYFKVQTNNSCLFLWTIRFGPLYFVVGLHTVRNLAPSVITMSSIKAFILSYNFLLIKLYCAIMLLSANS